MTVSIDTKSGMQSVSANLTPVEVTLKNGCIIRCEVTITDLIHVIHGPFNDVLPVTVCKELRTLAGKTQNIT